MNKDIRARTVKYRDETWDLPEVDTKEYTHCFHTYPAMMIPQIARKLLKHYGVEGGWLLDPYCGTGTSLVEASLFGMHSVGCDINPLVRLIATAKLTPIPRRTLASHLDTLNDCLFQVEFSDKVPEKPVPDVPNLAYWFSEEVIRSLAFLRAWIDEVEEETVRNFLSVAFSETVRECSYTRNGEFKLHRMPAEKLADFQPDVFGIFRKKLSRNQHGLAMFMEKRHDVDASVSCANTVSGEFPMPRPLGGYDIVVTSPPYGDSHTTVAYGQFSRLAAEWLGLPNARKVDRLAMGGHPTDSKLTDSPVVAAIEEIRSVDEKRAQQVAAFYTDLGDSIYSVAKMLSSRATVCYVVGNRSVKGVVLPTDAFVISEFSRYGFSHQETIVRNIPNKRMPHKNSPTNVAGKTAATMNEENIVVCQRTNL